MYVRAKRRATTVFLEARKGDAAATLRNTLAAILEREPAQLRLLNADRAEINLARTLEESKIEDGAIIYYVYPSEDGSTRERHTAHTRLSVEQNGSERGGGGKGANGSERGCGGKGANDVGHGGEGSRRAWGEGWR